MYIKPAEGKEVPDPDKGGYLSKEGRNVEQTAYWLNRLRDVDVVEADPPKEKKS